MRLTFHYIDRNGNATTRTADLLRPLPTVNDNGEPSVLIEAFCHLRKDLRRFHWEHIDPIISLSEQGDERTLSLNGDNRHDRPAPGSPPEAQ